MGQGWLSAGGSDERTETGRKKTESAARGSVTQPWSPNWRASLVMPFAIVRRTA